MQHPWSGETIHTGSLMKRLSRYTGHYAVLHLLLRRLVLVDRIVPT